MQYEVTVHLTSNQSESIRTLLEKNGFVIYQINKWTLSLKPLKHSKVIPFQQPRDYFFCCIYNGEKSLEDMQINRRKLVEHPSFIDMQERTRSSTSVEIISPF